MKFFLRATTTVAALLVLASCGGGGEGDDRCSSEGALIVVWNYSQPRLAFPVNKTTSYAPTISGVPASCAGRASFRMASGPAFLSIDAATGVITGSPQPSFVCVNAPVGTTGSCSTGAEFRMAIPGYSEVIYRPLVDVTPASTP
jgi:hypothetical protein